MRASVLALPLFLTHDGVCAADLLRGSGGGRKTTADAELADADFFRVLFDEEHTMSMPTNTPSSMMPSLQITVPPTNNEGVCAEEEPKTFSNTLIFNFEGPPGFGSEPEVISQLEDALLLAYNSVAMCDQLGAFINATSVSVDTGANDVVSLDDSGLGDYRQFTWIVDFEGECRGCPADENLLFLREEGDDISGDGSQCFCSFPTTEAYVAECNDVVSIVFPGLSVRGVTTSTQIQLGLGGMPPLSSFSTSYLLTGTFGGGGGSGLNFDFDLIGRAFVATYNSISFFGSSTCDVEKRVLVSAVPVNPPADADIIPGNPFSVVFNIQGTCRNCGSTTVVFGNHEVNSLDITATCPVGAQLRCPSIGEFQQEFQATLGRLEEAGLLPEPQVTGISENSNSSACNNLLINGDFEFGNTTGWNNPGNVVAQSFSTAWNSGFPFDQGLFILHGGEGAANKIISQSVDLTSFATVIDGDEGAEFLLSAWLVGLQPTTASIPYDEVFMRVSFVDAAGAVLLLTPELTDPIAPGDLAPNPNIWDLVTERGTIPAFSRAAIISLRFFRPIGFFTDSYADNIVFCVDGVD